MVEQSRIKWVQDEMGKQGVDLFAAFTASGHNMGATNSTRVLSGFKNMGDSCVLLDADGERTVIVAPSWDAERAREQAPGCTIIASDDLAGAVVKAANRRGRTRRIGVDGLSTLAHRRVAPIQAEWGDRVVQMNGTMQRAGARKTPDEIRLAREVAALAEKIFDRLLEVAKPGMPEYALASDLYRHSKALGADDNFLLMASSQMPKGPRPPGRRILAKGDLILGEISPGAGGHFVQICRTAVLGPINQVQQRNHDILWESMQAGLAAAAAGNTVAHVANQMNEAVAKHGFAEYCRPPYMRVRGHGLGSVSSLPGDIGTDNQMVLEEGMTFVMHPNQFLPGGGYMMVGEPVVITKTCAEPLTTRFSRLTSIPV